ncbi:uncharacterized protein J3R85_013243 [Psidium guajava]|nr:uncharacterized protein J3R85_013243 [Psidium guajava]
MSLFSGSFSSCLSGDARRVNCEGEDHMRFDSRSGKDHVMSKEETKEIAKREPNSPPILVAYFPGGYRLSPL